MKKSQWDNSPNTWSINANAHGKGLSHVVHQSHWYAAPEIKGILDTT